MTDKVLTGYGWYRLYQSIQTNISRDYLDGEKVWNEWAGLRECLQNAMDEADYMAQTHGGDPTDYVKVDKRTKHIVIRDQGRGCDFENILLLGKSGKRGLGYRGEKGEGQLMAFLVFAKLEISIEMMSQDWMVRARFGKYNGGTNDVLVLDVYRQKDPDNPKRLQGGTVWRIGRTSTLDYYMNNLADYFPDIRKSAKRQRQAADRRRDETMRQQERKADRAKNTERKRKSTSSSKTVFLPRPGKPCRLYLRGIWVRDLTAESGMPALFSYNLEDVDINRDRDMVDSYQLRENVGAALMSSDMTRMMMEYYWKYAVDSELSLSMEYNARIMVSDNIVATKWKRAFYRVYGEQACIHTNSYAATDATASGWEVVNLNSVSKAFAERLGIKTDRQASGFGDEDFTIVEATSRERKIIRTCGEICAELDVPTTVVHIVGKVMGNKTVCGFYKDNRVYILRSVFKRGGLAVLKVMLHELGHYNTGETDFTRGFTDWFLLNWLAVAQMDAAKIEKLQALLAELQ